MPESATIAASTAKAIGGKGDEAQKDHQSHHRPVVGMTFRFLREPVEHAGPDQRPHDEKHRRDRPGRRIGQRFERQIIGQEAKGETGRRAEDRDHFGRKTLPHEHDEHQRHDAQCQDGLAIGRQGKLDHHGTRD
jgi:hypothetical protein